MLNCYTQHALSPLVPVHIIEETKWSSWLDQQNSFVKKWVSSLKFLGKAEQYFLLPDQSGKIDGVVFIIKNTANFLSIGLLPRVLPEGTYTISEKFPLDILENFLLAWGLGAYQFTRYVVPTRLFVQLLVPSLVDAESINNRVNAIYLVRDLINTPAEDMGPEHLAEAASNLGKRYGASVTQLIGEELLSADYPSIYAVGRAGRPPRLIDLRWGEETTHPKVTLVGKGVCFDAGGLDLKSASGMLLMKKDMGGAANALGLSQMIMHARLPIRLRVLIPAVENVVAGNAYKPGDIIKTRSGLTVEIGNTDAEGRVILADALTEAVSENPALLIDFATLTGAARVAVGPEISAVFTTENHLINDLIMLSEIAQDPIWPLPLYQNYRKFIETPFANINNAGNSPYAGAITAALFLQTFVPSSIPWLHFDFNAYNVSAMPGRPEGGEAMAIRTLFSYLLKRFPPE